MFMLGRWGVETGRGVGVGGGLQLEVSEWTLPGPSVGDVTDEGVGASCQPPFVCEDETARGQSDTCGRNVVQTGTKLRAAAPPVVLNTLREKMGLKMHQIGHLILTLQTIATIVCSAVFVDISIHMYILIIAGLSSQLTLVVLHYQGDDF